TYECIWREALDSLHMLNKGYGRCQNMSMNSNPILNGDSELLTAALAGIGDGLIIANPEGKILYINSVTTKITGWNADEAYKTNIRDVFKIVNMYTNKILENPIEQALKTRHTVGLQNNSALITKDGSKKFI